MKKEYITWKVKKKDLIIFAIWSLIIFYVFEIGLINFGESVGISNGKPYCLRCPFISTSLPVYKVGDYVRHRWDAYEKFTVIHKLIDIKGNKLKFNDGINNYWINKSGYIGTILFEWDMNVTDNFKEACEYEFRVVLEDKFYENTCRNLWRSYCEEKKTVDVCIEGIGDEDKFECVKWEKQKRCIVNYDDL